MARSRELGSPSKEFPLDQIDRTLLAIRPGWTYDRLRQYARANTNDAIPAILWKRYLLIDDAGHIAYDRLLSLINAEPIDSARVRKVLYFTYFFRDPRLRRFICEVVAGPDGRWRFGELVDKNNKAFLEKFMAESTAKKVRSNIEYHLSELGIVNLTTRKVHLELEDGWLVEAMQVASQHVPGAAERRAMTSAPMDYLIAHGWNGLADATPEDLLGLAGSAGIEWEPAEDQEIQEVPPRPREGQRWDRPPPTPAQQQAPATIADPVKRERAGLAHYRLERITVAAALARGYDPRYTALIDLYFGPDGGRVLCEIKSSTQGNLRSQVRRGVSQLFEYRYFYRALLGEAPTLLLVLEIEPPARQAWLADYLRSIGITLAWKDPGADRLVTTVAVPGPLAGIVAHV